MHVDAAARRAAERLAAERGREERARGELAEREVGGGLGLCLGGDRDLLWGLCLIWCKGGCCVSFGMWDSHIQS